LRRVLLKEEVAELPDLLSHLHSHYLPTALNLRDRVRGGESSQRCVVDVNGAILS
jgi:hypothetical protein